MGGGRALPEHASASDRKHALAQRQKYCVGAAYPDGPERYDYVPARCVRHRGSSSSSSSSNNSKVMISVDENQEQEDAPHVAAVMRRLQREEASLRAFADALSKTIIDKYSRVAFPPRDELMVANGTQLIVTKAMHEFVKHLKKKQEEATKPTKSSSNSVFAKRVPSTCIRLLKLAGWRNGSVLTDPLNTSPSRRGLSTRLKQKLQLLMVYMAVAYHLASYAKSVEKLMGA